MKTKNLLLVLVGAAIGFGFSAAAQQSPPVADFAIEIAIDRSENGVDMKCMKGCMWRRLSFSCGPGVDCVSSIDETGTPAE